MRRLNDIDLLSTDRISVGVPFDELLGGGAPLGSTVLLTGVPGAGKSTVALTLADRLDESVVTLYNCCEENNTLVAARARRLQLNGHFYAPEIFDALQLEQECKSAGVRAIIQDSLQSLRVNRKLDSLLDVVAVLKRMAASGAFVIAIGQVNKAGKPAGLNEIQHEFDAHAHVTVAVDGTRLIQMMKSRFGPAMLPPVAFDMTESGLVVRKKEVVIAPDRRVYVPRRRRISTGGKSASWLRALLR